ncbi:PqqD family protein [Pelagicoccus mobilis]|uniref:PqqD family protein n=1 Tax=Pelagicoccus mobilis TaxID=415221 RepID=A0A934RUH7_9BACT|nr:PqqD family protein [Pelagicoccus mobilis]MBK1875655.1 PqqD family protein [Pelagicoccus mobilis]
MKIDKSCIVSQSSEQLSCELDGEVVSMSIAEGSYFGINGVGSEIWRRIKSPRRVDELCQELVSKFEVSPEQCEADVLEFLEELRGSGLLTLSEEETL